MSILAGWKYVGMAWSSVGLISFLFLWCLFIVVSTLTALWMDEFSQFQSRTESGLFPKLQAVWFGICCIHRVSAQEEIWKTGFDLGSSFIKKPNPIKLKTNDFMSFEKILSGSLPVLLLETPVLGCEICAFQFCRVSERSATRGGVHITLMSMPRSSWPSAQC